MDRQVENSKGKLDKSTQRKYAMRSVMFVCMKLQYDAYILISVAFTESMPWNAFKHNISLVTVLAPGLYNK